HQLPFAAHWGDGTTSSSDGQYFRAGGCGEAAGQVNARYGDEPGVTFYTHLSNQYGPYYTQVISAIVRDAPYVLDGLLYHESDLRQNGLAVALRELGRLERTQFMLQWLQDPALRRRVHVGLNKGEARNALARAVFFNRLGELRDRRYENQRHRASGLNLLVAAM